MGDNFLGKILKAQTTQENETNRIVQNSGTSSQQRKQSAESEEIKQDKHLQATYPMTN